MSKSFASVKRAHHFSGIGKVILYQPIALANDVTAFVSDNPRNIINVTFEANRFSVDNCNNIFYAANLALISSAL